MRAAPRPTVFRGGPDPSVILLSFLAFACAKTAQPPGQDAAAVTGDGPAVAADGPDDRPLAPDGAPRPDASPAPDASPDGEPVPARCQVNTTRQPPFQVTFRLVNRGGRTVYLLQGCGGIAFGISSCASRYTDTLSPIFVCACDCADASCRGPVPCTPCPPETGLALAPGEAKEVVWRAQATATEDHGSFGCVRRTPLPAALYSVTVPVSDRADAILAGPRRVVSRSFELPAPGDVVEVALTEAPGDAGAPDAGVCEQEGPAPACAAPWDPASPCALDNAYTFGWEGGFSLWRDGSELVPPNRYSRTRTFMAPQPAITCRNFVPRCGADHDTFTTADVVEAFAAPDVVAALAQGKPQVYGYDSRPGDGTILAVRRIDGRGLFIGDPCGSAMPCQHPITPGLTRLKAILLRIEAQQLATPGCEALREP